jgi:membrane protein required for colicin V production
MVANWNAFDWLIAVIIAASMVAALRRGLVRAIFSLLGLIAGFQIAGDSYDYVASYMNVAHTVHAQVTARIVSFLIVAALVTLAFELAGRGLQHALRAIGLGVFDRILGAVFGFARGCLVCIGLLMVAANIAPHSSLLVNSVLSPHLFELAHDVSFLVPQYLQQEMAEGALDFKQTPQHWINRR